MPLALRCAWSSSRRGDPDRVLVEDVLVGRVHLRRADLRVAREGVACSGAALRWRGVAPLGQVGQLGQQHRGLQRVEPAVGAHLVVEVLPGPAVQPEPPRAARPARRPGSPSCPPSPQAPRFLLGKNERVPTVPSSPDIRQVPSIFRRAPMDWAPSSMTGNPCRRGDRQDLLHRRHLAEQVDHDDGPGAGRDRGLDGAGARC